MSMFTQPKRPILIKHHGVLTITFTIPMEGIGQGRGRAYMDNGIVKVTTPAKTRKWKNQVSQFARLECTKAGFKPDDSPFKIEVIAVYKHVKAPVWKKELIDAGKIAKTTKPDTDNIEKALFDAFNGICWTDDAQLVSTTFKKIFSATTESYLSVRITKLANMLPDKIRTKKHYEKWESEKSFCLY